jgi:hypothetical protein
MVSRLTSTPPIVLGSCDSRLPGQTHQYRGRLGERWSLSRWGSGWAWASGDRRGRSKQREGQGRASDRPDRLAGQGEGSRTVTRRGGGAGPGSLPLPGAPLPGASRGAGGSAPRGGRAGPVAASWRRRRESVAAPGPRVESSLKTGQCGCPVLPVLSPLARCGLQCPHSAEGNAEAALDSVTGVHFPGSSCLFSCLVVGVRVTS